MKIIVQGCSIAQMKRFDALITTQKTPALCEVPFLKKSRKTTKKWSFLKNCHFGQFFLIFSKMGLRRELGYFVL